MSLPGTAGDATQLSMVQYGFFFAASGKGILVGLIAGACLLLADWLCALYFHDSHYYADHGWPKMAASLVAALIVWRLNGHSEETVPGSELDADTKPFFTKRDTLFFAPAQYWPLILCGIGILMYFWPR